MAKVGHYKHGRYKSKVSDGTGERVVHFFERRKNMIS